VLESGLSKVIGGIREERDRSSLAKAENDFLLFKATEDNAYDEDDDYGTIEERYTSNVHSGLGEIAARITNPIARNEFVARAKVSIEHGRQRMEEVARKKEYDFELADLDTRLEKTATMGIKDDFQTAYASGVNLIDSNIALTEQGKVKAKRAFRDRLVTGRLDMLDPENRMGELKRLKPHLTPDLYAKYMRESKNALRNDRAQAVVDQFSDQKLTREEAMRQGRKLFPDPDDRDEFNRRMDYQLTKDHQVEVENMMELENKYWLSAREGNLDPRNLSDEERFALGKTGMTALYNAQAAYASGKSSESSRQVLWDLYRLRESTDPAAKTKLTEYFIENSNRLSTSDWKSWAAEASKAGAPPEIKSLLTMQQTIVSKLMEQDESFGNTYTKGSDKIILGKANEWFMNYQDLYGKVPSDTEQEAKIDQLFLRFPTTAPFGGSDTMALFEMNDKQLGMAHYEAKRRNPKSYDKAVQFVIESGIDIKSIMGRRRVLEAYDAFLKKDGE
jgi:hypothetical protein